MTRVAPRPLVALLLLLLAACDTTSEPPPTFTGTSTLSGTVVAPDGSTPLAGATVFVPDGTASLGTQLVNDCPTPTVSFVAFACTDSSGNFELTVDVTNGSVTLHVFKGSFSFTVEVAVGSQNAMVGTIDVPSNPGAGAARMAVVTGSFDEIENLLAKLGFGDVSTTGALILGTEEFDLYDSIDRLPPDYPQLPALFEDGDGDGNVDIHDYDIVFINCGADESLLSQPEIVAELQAFVNGGGTLYVTDLAYDYVEQVFPGYIDFFGSDGIPADATPEDLDAAQVGTPDIIVNGTVLDETLEQWLGSVTCGGASCLQDDGTVLVQGFLNGWAVMNTAHEGSPSPVKFWVEGPVSFQAQNGVIKPLTTSFQSGSGTVIFSSYHTEHKVNPNVSPQERILQFLVFE